MRMSIRSCWITVAHLSAESVNGILTPLKSKDVSNQLPIEFEDEDTYSNLRQLFCGVQRGERYVGTFSFFKPPIQFIEFQEPNRRHDTRQVKKNTRAKPEKEVNFRPLFRSMDSPMESPTFNNVIWPMKSMIIHHTGTSSTVLMNYATRFNEQCIPNCLTRLIDNEMSNYPPWL